MLAARRDGRERAEEPKGADPAEDRFLPAHDFCTVAELAANGQESSARRAAGYDIVCHGIDLKVRTQFHYGKRQKKTR